MGKRWLAKVLGASPRPARPSPTPIARAGEPQRWCVPFLDRGSIPCMARFRAPCLGPEDREWDCSPTRQSDRERETI
ncbi:hypothetical protein ZHAS_00017110 [Anopheles sinensis]|uniref:Uncharacterized protein n=1 Tax=Anopheles sinensis TaxID=74873 RepID=A0A084WF58_ANOSI|nr:hypothetical protein ZHAS_00017110 [Anopheles sinensis]